MISFKDARLQKMPLCYAVFSISGMVVGFVAKNKASTRVKILIRLLMQYKYQISFQ